MYDVAIIGGGVVGCAIARELSKYSLDVVLIEKQAEVGFGTSKTNSGIIHPGHHSSVDSLKGQLVVKGNKLFDKLQEELGFGFKRIGELVIARNEEELKGLQQLKEQGENKGVEGLEIWDSSKIQREEPNLSHSILGALYAPTAGVINPYEFAFALIESATANGVELQVDSPVEDIRKKENSFDIQTPNRNIEAKYIINCAGVFSDKIAQMVGDCNFEICPRKGEEYLLDKRLKGIVKRLIFPLPSGKTKGTLIIPTFDGTIMVGPTALETEDREDVSTTSGGSQSVFDFVKQICPSIDARMTIAEFAGLRAASHTGDFIIGPTAVKGFINVAGIQSPGLTASPAIAKYVVDILAQEGVSLIEKDSFLPYVDGPTRFAQLPYEKQEEKIRENPKHARIVCRCELVTEGEIHEAIDHGARTLDGIKFRTRAGMGRCQGGFCTSRCMEALSDRLNKPIEQITKRGGNSWLVIKMEDENEASTYSDSADKDGE